MVFEVPSNPNHSVILVLFSLPWLLNKFSRSTYTSYEVLVVDNICIQMTAMTNGSAFILTVLYTSCLQYIKSIFINCV